MDTDIFAAFAQYGLAGLIIFLLGTGAHFWTSKVWEYVTNTLMPKYWDVQEKRIIADQEYRTAYVAKMDTIADETSELKDRIGTNTETIRSQQAEFQRLTVELHDLNQNLRGAK